MAEDWMHKEIDDQIEVIRKELEAHKDASTMLMRNKYNVSIQEFEKHQKARYYLLSSLKIAIELKGMAH